MNSIDHLKLSPCKPDRPIQHRSTREQLGNDSLVTPGRGSGRSTLFDSFELNAVVTRLSSVLNAVAEDGRSGGRRARRGLWFLPEVLSRLKRAFLGRRGD